MTVHYFTLERCEAVWMTLRCELFAGHPGRHQTGPVEFELDPPGLAALDSDA